MLRDRDFEALLTVSPEEVALRHDDVRGYRTKTTVAGDMLEVDAYPIITMPRAARSRARAAITSMAQQIVNRRNRERKLCGLMDANFGPADVFMTITYAGALPTYTEAQSDMRKYIRLVRKYLKKQGKALKYIYALGYDDEGNKKTRLHAHIIMTGGNRDELEAIWQDKVHAGRVNSRRVQPGEDGLRELARYFLKQHKGGRGWSSSKNLTKPTVKTSDRKLSRLRVEKMAREVDIAAKEIMEKLYPGYKLVEAWTKTSEYMPGAYVYARMMRQGPKGAGR